MMNNIIKLTLVFFLSASISLLAGTKEIDIKTNLHCGSCKSKIESNLKKTSGVIESTADVDSKIVHVKFDDSKTSSDKIKQTISDLGYKADFVETKECKTPCSDSKSSKTHKSCCDTKATKSNPKSK